LSWFLPTLSGVGLIVTGMLSYLLKQDELERMAVRFLTSNNSKRESVAARA
jgi:hypothetical protein